MTDELKQILERFSPDEPYVWRLHVGDEAFLQLEAYVAANGASLSRGLTEGDARLVIVYLAEWYKRIYKGGEMGQTNAADGIDLKRVWRLPASMPTAMSIRPKPARGYGNTPSMCWADLP